VSDDVVIGGRYGGDVEGAYTGLVYFARACDVLEEGDDALVGPAGATVQQVCSEVWGFIGERGFAMPHDVALVSDDLGVRVVFGYRCANAKDISVL